MTAIPVLSLTQPWATLVQLRLKWIETRGWATGAPKRIAIASTAAAPGTGRVGDFWFGPSAYEPDRWVMCADQYEGTAGLPPGDIPLPLGVILCTRDLTSCALIGGPTDFRTGLFEGEAPLHGDRDVIVLHDGQQHARPPCLMLDRAGGPAVDVTDQLPFGNFTAGRYGFLLEGGEDVDPPVQFRGGVGFTRRWEAA